MIVDTSALVAILKNEPEAGALVEALAGADGALMSHGTLVELCVVLWRRFGAGETDVRTLLDEYGIEIARADEEQAWAAGEAYRRWGPNSGTGARLNLGDCFAYALAHRRAEALLFTGADFGRTDAVPALRDRRPQPGQ